MSKQTFHLGLSLAGAVSAGAYTAGFVDYLLEALSEWELAKQAQKNNPNSNIPNHNVVIDAIGGASAGGMVGMIATLALYAGNWKPVKKVSNKKTGNILYDSWVFLDDDLDLYNEKGSGKATFEKMLDTSDINPETGTPSLLNSSPIDNIAERVFNELPTDASLKNLPEFIAKDLRLLITLTSLRPLDYKVKLSRIKSKFLDETPSHRVSSHDVLAHFKLNYDAEKDKNHYLPFHPHSLESRDFLKKITKATGAFPIGLKPRYFDNEFATAYLNNSLKVRKSLIDDNLDVLIDEETSSNFQFTAIDGGTINNEPFDEVLRHLIKKHGEPNIDNPKFGTVLIDPFPSFFDSKKTDTVNYKISSVLGILGALVPTILNQARYKQTDTYGVGLFKLMSFPRKLKPGKMEIREHPPLATGALEGFGGFLDIKFRQHDFFLGRDNARNFLRGILFLECDKNNPNNLFYGVSDTAIEEFRKKVKQKDGSEKIYMPIIPDVSKIKGDTNPTSYEVEDFPQFNAKAFKALEKPIKNRVKAILKAELKGRIKRWWLRPIVSVFRGVIAGKITKWIIEQVETDFKNGKMYN
ncbi:patatin-like phospholipase family protein [Winogradskyella psychrotolerans]|uniref:patatin-like phospholipase family protein n=1 Tax=Winogradskyella psychrotolerans TaxID=1344585 RepID=UPI001C07EBEA|nr:patatin-like phospholipase family protein [Winogradskyella psychrotolerans]MBU2921044.1 patatin-like phospholipase family protein [Winogradskyella psychrotolerans]